MKSYFTFIVLIIFIKNYSLAQTPTTPLNGVSASDLKLNTITTALPFLSITPAH